MSDVTIGSAPRPPSHRPPRPAPPPRPPEDRFERVPVIVTSPDPAARDIARKHGARIEELPLQPGGFVAEVAPEAMPTFIAELPPDAAVQADNHSLWPEELMRVSRPRIPGAPAFVPRLPGIDKVHQQGIRGEGQGIAVIDSGLKPHRDLGDRLVAWKDFVEDKPDPHDPDGHGTHVAGVLLGDGSASQGEFVGAAPAARLVACRIETVSDAIKALQWVIDHKDEYGIKVVNMSLGDCVSKSYREDAWARKTQEALDAGLIVVVAASNECCGPSDPARCDLSISTPGYHPDVITVGAYDNRSTATMEDDRVAPFSARGPTPIDGIEKPDVLAPGVDVVGWRASGSRIDKRYPGERVGHHYLRFNGTSQATPMVAGLAALLKQVRPDLSQDAIKRILKETASSHLTDARTIQGGGLVQADRAVARAREWPKVSGPQPEAGAGVAVAP